ncbi:hypothetical protein AYW79_06465 [Ferroacidibacillus organovorans]|uniref:Flagellar protein FliT n=1 Tax=Ferroacidibacillus organovorans TaxID=1765683 RepID=A0A853KB12_9BACL|nr:hypothetical protein AYJ22_06240 [Ferroacidibacillus organovorans]OAG94255.1 hypothetical protein AYW79_06465 [Ferroacidibacillus organovorans]
MISAHEMVERAHALYQEVLLAIDNGRVETLPYLAYERTSILQKLVLSLQSDTISELQLNKLYDETQEIAERISVIIKQNSQEFSSFVKASPALRAYQMNQSMSSRKFE